MNQNKAPRIAVDLHALGELDPAIAARLGDALTPGPDGHMTDAEVFDDDPPAAFVGAVRRKLAAERPARSRWWVALPLLIAASAAVVVVWTATPVDDGPDILVRGGAAHLEVWRKTGDGAEPLADGTVARAGDRLQLAYTTGGRGFGLIYSVDGRGVVTEHHRFGGEAPPGRVKLDASYVLDDAPAFEAFYLVTSDAAFDPGAVLDAARAAAAEGAPIDLPPGLHLLTVVVRKAP